MVVRAANAATRHRPRPQTTQSGVLPAPTKGIDARVSLAAGDLSVCPYTYNIMPSEDGMTVRNGWREFVLAVEDTTGYGCTTMIPLEGLAGTADKLFAVTNEGIWDVTTYDTSPTKKVAFTIDNTANAGYGMYINYVNQAGAQFIYYADNLNGLYFYTVSTDTWAVVTNITGLDETDICGIVVHKLRVWVWERDQASAWYLPINAITGAANEFVFGGKFTRGGYVAGMYNWTLDGGAGVDDYLVIASSAGDALIYQGEDPSASSTWSIVGTYDIGAAPVDYRAGLEYAGELFILTGYGLISMDEILRGANAENPLTSNLAFKITNVLRKSMLTLRETKGWNPIFFPSQGIIVLVSPIQSDGTYIQYVLDLTTKGWGYWRGLPILSAGIWQNKLYFGTADNKVMIMDVNLDNVLITPPAAPAPNGEPIEYSILHTSSDMGSPGQMKRGAFLRPNFRSEYLPAYDTRILYDFDLAEFSSSANQSIIGDSSWDSAIWSASTWNAGSSSAWSSPAGVNGIGRTLAAAIRGSSAGTTTLISTDIMWNTGSIL